MTINVPPTNNNESDRINRDIIRNSHFNIGFADNSTFNIQNSTLNFPIRLTARAERYCGGEPLIQLLLDDAAKERCRERIEEICNSQAKKING